MRNGSWVRGVKDYSVLFIWPLGILCSTNYVHVVKHRRKVRHCVVRSRVLNMLKAACFHSRLWLILHTDETKSCWHVFWSRNWKLKPDSVCPTAAYVTQANRQSRKASGRNKAKTQQACTLLKVRFLELTNSSETTVGLSTFRFYRYVAF